MKPSSIFGAGLCKKNSTESKSSKIQVKPHFVELLLQMKSGAEVLFVGRTKSGNIPDFEDERSFSPQAP
jgi:hypothetical protein